MVISARLLVAVLLTVVPARWALAVDGEFHYAVERFTIDGNIHGPHDGTPDLVQEFDGAMASSGFRPFFGTSSVAGGALHLDSPGTFFSIPELGLELNQSDVFSTGPLIRDGAGDARLEALFQAATLGTNHFVHITLSLSGPGGPGAFIGLAYTNYDADVAAHLVGPATVGPAMFGHWVSGALGGLVPIAGNSIPVDPSSTGGAFVLALDYDDTAKTITPSFSLDGGVTFEGGLDALDVESFDGSGGGTGMLIIGADPRQASTGPPPPTCPWGYGSGSVTVGRRRDGTYRVSTRLDGVFDSADGVIFNPVSEGVQLVVADAGSATPVVTMSGATSVPPGVPGTGCDPRDGWTTMGFSRFVYRNHSNALPPACTPGSAGGLTRLSVRRGTNAWNDKVQASFKGVSLPPVALTGPMGVVVTRGTGAAQRANGTCLAMDDSSVPCAARGATLRCR